MKRVLTVLAVALVMAALLVATAMPAFARITESGNQGHLDENPGGKCPKGQQEEPVTPGATKKCA